MHHSTLGHPRDKPSCRHAIHCGLVGLALALGGFLISLQHFFHTPNSFQLPLKTTLHATHPPTRISTLVPEGVLCTVGMSVLSSVSSLHPIHTMCTMPIHEVPTYAHWPSSHPSMVGAPLCAHHTHFPTFQLLGTHVDPLFCQPGPFTACTPPHTPFCAPLHTPAHLCASPFLGLSPLSNFPLTLDPLLATMV